MKDTKPILVVDFDRVLHSYKSGWRGARNIPDPPVPGALEFLIKAIEFFNVQIYSCRSRQWGGKRAMKKWLKKEYIMLALDWESTPRFFREWISQTAFADPWNFEVRWAIKRLLKKIRFPTKKPAAFLMIDDRAMCFTGTFPHPEELLKFRPWSN